jgi:YVTN family beta-propeller protein
MQRIASERAPCRSGVRWDRDDPGRLHVDPAGRQTDLGDLPLAAAISPDGQWLAVSNNGQGAQSLQLVNAATGTVSQTLSYPAPKALFVGLAFAPDGKTLYASGGGNEVIRRYRVDAGVLTEQAPIPLPTSNPADVKINPFPSGIALTPDGQRLLVADQQADAFSVVELASGAVHTVAAGHKPYGVVSSPDGHSAYVTNEGANTVSVMDLTGSQPTQHKTITVGTHPNKALVSIDGKTLFVADGDSDQVSVIDVGSNAVTRTISLAPYPDAQVGSNPEGLAQSPDGRTLYVANAGNNDVALIDLGTDQVAGLIPTGWYPTAIVATDRALFIANAKGLGAGPNNGPGRPNPYRGGAASPDQYSGSMMVGTLSTVGLPLTGAQLAAWTAQVRRNDGFDTHGEVRTAGAVATSIVPRTPDDRSPLQHVIYIVKENRTYDQVFGSLGKGNGDPSLNLFGEESAPNSRSLERDFTTFDNFYADAEVSAQGWNWTVAANSDPYSEQVWSANYSARNGPYPSESGDSTTAPNRDPAQAYIWDRLATGGITFRNYGFYVDAQPDGSLKAQDPLLDANTDHGFRGFDLHCPDAPDTFTPGSPSCGPARFAEWKKEFDSYVAHNNLPTVELVRLPNDHNAGTKNGAPTPRAFVADNDWALGQLVDAVTHSRYCASTAIFVTEDDAQDGPDHVDAHRTLAEVISPYTHTGKVDSTFYSTASMLRTMELIIGLRPLTQFDAYATPMLAAFTDKPDATPYSAKKPTQNLHETNPVADPSGAMSDNQDLTSEDKINMRLFNQAIWTSIKGPHIPMPAPRHTIFPPPSDQ